MNKPSVKTLDRAFPGKGKALRLLLDSATAVRLHPAAIARESTAYHPHTLATLRLEALNDVAETYGVEYCTRTDNPMIGNDWSPTFEYLNTGDSYTPTIIRFSDGRYIVADVGSIVERGGYE